MFQNLRVNNQIYILHKEDKHFIEIGSVVSVSAPKPKYPMTQPFTNHAMDMVVDIVVSVNGQNSTFQNLPAGGDIADFGQSGNIVVSCSRDAMNNEISMIRQKMMDRVNSRDHDLLVISSCDEMLTAINPEFAEKRRQEQEISTLKGQMSDMSKNMAELMEMNKQLMQRLGYQETTKK